MARNLVQEKREEENRVKSDALEASKEAMVKDNNIANKPAVEEKVVYITTEQVTLNNLNVIIAQLDIIHSRMIEGFKQVGVKFEEAKEK